MYVVSTPAHLQRRLAALPYIAATLFSPNRRDSEVRVSACVVVYDFTTQSGNPKQRPTRCVSGSYPARTNLI